VLGAPSSSSGEGACQKTEILVIPGLGRSFDKIFKGAKAADLPRDELIHILDGNATVEIVCDDGLPQSFALRAGMLAVIPQGAWHRFHSAAGVTLMTATPFPGEVIERDVDDPRTVARKPA
jgi:mannose-6-phosphate isomerase-like protein (cupin superfamily)